MAEKRRFLDVWIVESNTVYKEVPFTVVADWVQQGRLLEDDKLKPSGTAEWFRLGAMPAFAAYLPKPEPFRVEDEAEAREQVTGGFTWRRKPDDEEDDVDMIPLIDISLVLLIFFIMTTTGAFLMSTIPQTVYANATSNPDIVWIGITKDKDENPVYSLGKGDHRPASPEDQDLIAQELLLQRLDLLLDQEAEPVEVQIKCDESLPAGIVLRLRVELGKRRAKISKVWAGVRDKVIIP
jgi:biopolymer transport protein ExbD